MTRLRVDLELCEGYGNCVLEAEDYFELTEDGVVRLVHQEVLAADLMRVELAVSSCPVAALLVEQA